MTDRQEMENDMGQHTLTIIAELEELLEDLAKWKEEGIEIEEASVYYAIQFAKRAIIANQFPNPHIEIHPDGEVAFTWRKADRGIINIAFNKHGVATWAAYFDHNQRRTFKGRFNVEDSISRKCRILLRSLSVKHMN